MATELMLESLYAEYKTQVKTFEECSIKITQLAELIKSYGGIARTAKELNGIALENIMTDIRDSLYPINSTWSSKILFAIRKFSEPISIRELYAFICANERVDFSERGDTGKSILSSITARMEKQGDLVSQNIDGKKRFSLAHKNKIL
jgi:hypothetical protein